MTKSLLKIWDITTLNDVNDRLTQAPTYFDGSINYLVENLNGLLDAICARHTGFTRFADLMAAKGSYTPTIRCAKATNPSATRRELQELRVLADCYDWRMKQRQDARRAYRA
jgi:hypothetical protein